MMKVGTTTTFEAAHRLPNHPGICARLHGHSYRVQIEAEGQLDETGAVIWFESLDDFVAGWISETMDHRFIASPEEDPELLAAVPDHVICETGDPTAENLAAWIGRRCLQLDRPDLKFSVKVWEIHGWGECWAEWDSSER
jgi:6-pyruvoyltetrahydropterin/6-carboxytetrahydropterin synthase